MKLSDKRLTIIGAGIVITGAIFLILLVGFMVSSNV
jgi:hypothetical protein